nr:baseplate J/gp47 family protein [Moraxella sp.]
MSRIDLSGLPAPDVLIPIDYENMLAAIKADLISRDPSLTDALSLESDPLTKLLESVAYLHMLKNNQVNQTAKAMLLAYATGTTLDHLASAVNVSRLLVKQGNPNAVPPMPDIYESDDAFRRRIQLEPERASAGSEGAYMFWALSSDGDVRDISVVTATAGVVTVYVQSHSELVASDILKEKVRQAVDNPNRKPFTDQVRIASGQPFGFDVQAELTLYPGPDKDVVMAAARAELDKYLEKVRYLGYDVTISGLHHALHQAGVQRVKLLAPLSDINLPKGKYANCTGVMLGAVEYRDV